jgi:hypothetical protein
MIDKDKPTDKPDDPATGHPPPEDFRLDDNPRTLAELIDAMAKKRTQT